MTIKPVYYVGETRMGLIPLESYSPAAIPLCRHDEAMAEIDGLTKERDAAFAMSRCECGTDEACANLVAKDGEIERLQAENAALRRQLEGNGTTLYAVIADIRQKSGVGVKPMLSELADAIAERIADERNKALDEACELVATITRDELKDSEGVSPPDYFDEGTSAAYEAIRALKDNAP